MGQKENKLKEKILVEMPDDQRLFRINSGMAWAGEIITKTADKIVLKNPRPFHGAPSGWPDLAGWTTKKITQDMVGQEIAVFTGIEIKATGKQSKHQKKFEEVLTDMGGVYDVATGED